MATLVFTAVGTALGGPLGGALGALLGQGVDAAVFAPKARQGARLSDLKVQTSSYGDRIPKIHGTMRVAGTVIWATDLIERRSKRSNGKGRPKTVDYSYSASFAVAVSSRSIQSVGRIWADGNLLRDADGRWAENVTMRLYDGNADQKADPLIASVIGSDQCSAFRGIAYLVFEELELAPFGNRIPQLSFEIVADVGPIGCADLAAGLMGLVAERPGPEVIGFAAGGGRLAEVVASLADWGALVVGSNGSMLRLDDPAQSSATPLNGALLFGQPAINLRPDEDRRVAWERVPAAVRIRHFDPARDYQTSEQSAVVVGAEGAPQVMELAGAISAAEAKSQIERHAQGRAGQLRTLVLRGGPGALGLELGMALSFDADGFGATRWRLAERRVSDDGCQLTLVEASPAEAGMADVADGGSAIVIPALPDTGAVLVAFDVPGDGENPRQAPIRVLAAAGLAPGWRGADLWWVPPSDSDSEPLGRIDSALALGTLASWMQEQHSRLIEHYHVDVQLVHDDMQLANTDSRGLATGANLAMVGGELIQFARAEPLGAARWRLSGLLRGRGGTEYRASGHSVGTPFVLINDAALFILPETMAQRAIDGATIEWRARGGSNLETFDIEPGTAALLPLAPVHGQIRMLSDGSAAVRWVPRSRVGARWRDGADCPSGESTQKFRLTFRDPVGVNEIIETFDTEVVLASGSFSPGSPMTVEQIGDFGLSPPLTITLA